MAKIAYNACYGGFSLSHKACLHYASLKGFKLYALKHGDTYRDYIPALDGEGDGLFTAYFTVPEADWERSWSSSDIPRDDPDLISTIELLGDEASGSCAKLRVEDIEPGTLYRIDEYDGFESIATQYSYEWKVAS